MSATTPSRRQLTPLEPLVQAVEGASVLDEPAQKIAAQVRSNVQGVLKDVVSGTWLGHALHPLLTDVVIGSFTSATLLDLIGGEDTSEASQKLVGVGLLSYLPTALSGISDWADAEPVDDAVRRAGLVHANANLVGAGLYALSRRAHRRGRHGRATFFSLTGAGVLAVGGYLGAYLTYGKGIGPDQTVYDPGPEDWTPVSGIDSLQPDQPARGMADETPVMVLRQAGGLHALHDRCSHRGCSLSQGEIEGGEVVCACHGSRFDLRTGAVRRGPATAPQPVFEAREQNGGIEVRRVAEGPH